MADCATDHERVGLDSGIANVRRKELPVRAHTDTEFQNTAMRRTNDFSPSAPDGSRLTRGGAVPQGGEQAMAARAGIHASKDMRYAEAPRKLSLTRRRALLMIREGADWDASGGGQCFLMSRIPGFHFRA
jgi:hypothetical protein